MKTEQIEKEKQKLRNQAQLLYQKQVELRLKEKKLKEKHLYDMGRGAKKAGVDFLSDEEFLGAMLYLYEMIEKDSDIAKTFRQKGEDFLERENRGKTAVVIEIAYKDYTDNKAIFRKHNFKFNSLRKEFYGYVSDMEVFKKELGECKYKIEIINKRG